MTRIFVVKNEALVHCTDSYSYFAIKKVNFLAHYYFVQAYQSPYLTLGSVLPDLLRNHRSDWKIRLKQKEHHSTEPIGQIIQGWHLHEETDRLFHASAYFVEHSTALRKRIFPILSRKPLRPFFLAHIGYELLLDSLLLKNRQVDAGRFYADLATCSKPHLDAFFQYIELPDYASFYPFLQRFYTSRYLMDYIAPANLAHAMNQIGKRVWKTGFLPHEQQALETVLETYRIQLEPSYLEVFDFVEVQLAI